MAAPGSFAERLNSLFEACRREDGNPYTYEQVAAGAAAAGVSMSASYVWGLRKGTKTNPTVNHVKALAHFFGVPASYFFDDATTDKVDERLATAKAERQRADEIRHRAEELLQGRGRGQLMALRASELSEVGFQQVEGLLDVVYRLEKAEGVHPTE
ncbi:helix-turn-helix domain-containing protein [Allokutzneria albata]|uniref:HTH cro/C1-type domain-containing protein n=1 Tax=Allokutzneria albata TaxID=211114 RepID=A0A1G9Y7E1_ALLAB|nr:helix-turn-helix domain-containing protein [Allokutzneria albata]SDN04556.1 hypothetical protein SAMN04489726_4625 [Allokutzneria albata]